MLHLWFNNNDRDKKRFERWSDKDNQYLLDNYQSKNIRELSKELGRTAIAVKTRLSAMRRGGIIDSNALPIRKDQEWLDGLDDYLIENFTKKTMKEIAAEIGKSEMQVAVRVLTLREMGLIDVKHVTKAWSESEIDFLANNYESMTINSLAICLGRSANSVRCKLNAMRKQGLIDYKRR